MKVRMLLDTAYIKPRAAGEIVDVPDDFADRWIKNGIAEKYAEQKRKVEEEIVEEAGDEATGSYEEMSPKQLYKIAKSKGLDVAQGKSKEYYLEALAEKPE